MTNPKIGVLSDHFDQGSVNTNLWQAPSSGLFGGSPSLASIETAQVATTLNMDPTYADVSFPVNVSIPALLCTGSGGGNTTGIESVVAYDLTGSGLSVEFISSVGASSYTGYFALISGSNQLLWTVDNSGNLNAGDSSNGLSQVKHSPITSDYRFLRIRESGGTTYWDYSSDGTNWTNAVNVSNPFSLTGMTVFLGVGGTTGAGPATVIWANVNYVL